MFYKERTSKLLSPALCEHPVFLCGYSYSTYMLVVIANLTGHVLHVPAFDIQQQQALNKPVQNGQNLEYISQ